MVVAPGVSLQLSLEASPSALAQLPHIVFLGEDKQVATLRNRLKDNLALFDPNEGLVWNLGNLWRAANNLKLRNFNQHFAICSPYERLTTGDFSILV